MSTFASFRVPTINNEPNHHYAKDSKERHGLQDALRRMQEGGPMKVPLVIAGKEVRLILPRPSLALPVLTPRFRSQATPPTNSSIPHSTPPPSLPMLRLPRPKCP